MTTLPPHIATDRLILRLPDASDISIIAATCADINIARWIPPMPHPYLTADAAWYVDDCTKTWNEGTAYNCSIRDKKTDQFYGMVTLTMKEFNNAELGYWMTPDARGKGYAQEASRALMAAGFEHLGLFRIFAYTLSGNEPSQNVIRKLGFRYEGTQRQAIERFGQRYDHVSYGILKREWK